MRPEMNSNWFEISNSFEELFCLHGSFTVSNLESSNHFQKLSCLHGDFTAETFQTIARLYCACANDIFYIINANLIDVKQMLHYWLVLKQ